MLELHISLEESTRAIAAVVTTLPVAVLWFENPNDAITFVQQEKATARSVRNS